MSRSYLGRELPFPKLLQQKSLDYDRGRAIKRKVSTTLSKAGDKEINSKDKDSKESENAKRPEQEVIKAEEMQVEQDLAEEKEGNTSNIFANIFFRNKLGSKSSSVSREEENPSKAEDKKLVKRKMDLDSLIFQPKNDFLKPQASMSEKPEIVSSKEVGSMSALKRQKSVGSEILRTNSGKEAGSKDPVNNIEDAKGKHNSIQRKDQIEDEKGKSGKADTAPIYRKRKIVTIDDGDSELSEMHNISKDGLTDVSTDVSTKSKVTAPKKVPKATSKNGAEKDACNKKEDNLNEEEKTNIKRPRGRQSHSKKSSGKDFDADENDNPKNPKDDILDKSTNTKKTDQNSKQNAGEEAKTEEKPDLKKDKPQNSKSKKIRKFKTENFVRQNLKKGYKDRSSYGTLTNIYKNNYRKNGVLKTKSDFKRRKAKSKKDETENDQKRSENDQKHSDDPNAERQAEVKAEEKFRTQTPQASANFKFWFEDCPYLSKSLKKYLMQKLVMGKSFLSGESKMQGETHYGLPTEQSAEKSPMPQNCGDIATINCEVQVEPGSHANAGSPEKVNTNNHTNMSKNCDTNTKVYSETGIQSRVTAQSEVADKTNLATPKVTLCGDPSQIANPNEIKNSDNSHKGSQPSMNNISENCTALDFSHIADINDDSFLRSILKTYFGFNDFRPGQLEAIKKLQSKQSTLVVLSTGAGKSLIYQLPSLLMKGLTIVICPLLSLMADQILRLPFCLTGAALNSTLKPDQRKKVNELIHSGKVKVLYISPELLEKESFSNYPPINFICIDEAHCISEWSHNFRTSYFNLIHTIKNKLGTERILALTATATVKTKLSVCQQLKIDPVKNVVDGKSVVRKNLHISISRDKDQFKGLISLLKSSKFKSLKSLIVYCNLKRTTVAVAAYLVNNGYKAAAYHSDKTESQRAMIQTDFMEGRLRMVVATMAFGMGIDKPDIRGVIHLNLPKSVEQYVQEIGRAGRDGKDAWCHVFLNDEDFFRLRSVTYGEIVERNAVKRIVKSIVKTAGTGEVGAERQEEKLLKKRGRREGMESEEEDLVIESDKKEANSKKKDSANDIEVMESKKDVDMMECEKETDMLEEDSASMEEKEQEKDVSEVVGSKTEVSSAEDIENENIGSDNNSCVECDANSGITQRKRSKAREESDKRDVIKDHVLQTQTKEGHVQNKEMTTSTREDSMEKGMKMEEKLLSMRVKELCTELDLKKETITTIIMKIQNEVHPFFEFVSYGYVQCSIGFYKSLPEKVAERSEFAKLIIENAAKHRGTYKFLLTDICNVAKMTIPELFRELDKYLNYRVLGDVILKSRLRSSGEISYELDDEGYFFKVKYVLANEKLEEVVNLTKRTMNDVECTSLAKLDIIYSALRLYAAPSVDFMYKHGMLHKDVQDEAKNIILNDMDNECEIEIINCEKKIGVINSKKDVTVEQIIDDYFLYAGDDIKDFFEKFYPIEELLPLYRPSSDQKDGLVADIVQFIKSEPYAFLPEKSRNLSAESLQDKEITCVKSILRILQGVHSKNFPVMEWNKNPYWNKYYQYDSEYLYECVRGAVLIVLMDRSAIDSAKKVKTA